MSWEVGMSYFTEWPDPDASCFTCTWQSHILLEILTILEISSWKSSDSLEISGMPPIAATF